MLNLVTGEPTAILRHREQHAIRTIAMKNDIAFVGTYKGNLIQWNVSTRECLGVFIIHQSIIYAISVSDEYLFTGGADSTIVSRDLQTRYVTFILAMKA
jgi:WD40 repeat protein